ncbi:M4 family metallopeptidase [Nocardioides marmorisolisilvae]|uniref:M4 family metallopeptidase n=1 Tax=Nocardioides marmorisolisilvae TaxID=1542737 RepID=UPI001FEC03AD|nr:M4 family metallopeptidase [Nocardioides marmorisolisilvae]
MKRLVAGGAVAALITAAVVAVVPTGANATSTVRTDRPSPSARAKAEHTAAALVASRAPALHIGKEDTMVAQSTISSTGGLQYVPYRRNYHHLSVVGGDAVVVTDSRGQVLATSSGQKYRTDGLSTKATVSAARAASVAKRLVAKQARNATPTRVVYALGTPRLAWKVQVAGISTKGEYTAIDAYVDARTGKLISSREKVAYGTGTGKWNGPSPLSLSTTLSGSTYSMKHPTITNFSCQNMSFVTLTGSDDSWGNGVGTNVETGCVDAYFGIQQENSMLSTWLGRNSFDGNGGAWPIRVGLDDENAFYCDGSFGCPSGGMQVQIGHNTAGEWIGSLDVLGHEMGHGIDDHTPGGISGSGTQEFIGDVFGAATEGFANEPSGYDTPDYTVGEEVNLVGSGPIRVMYDPSQVGDPNCYSSSIPNAEVHAAAGPGDHFFYLLAEGSNPGGGKPTSPTCNSSTVAGIGLQKATQIMYNAMLMKTSSASYLKYRTWTLTAAKNLYPGSCTEFNAVKAAWTAVSVPAQSGDPTCTTGGNTVTVANPGSRTGTVGTATSLQMTATDSQAGQTLTWSATGLPAGLSINASSGLISGTPTTAATNSVTVTAKDTTNAQGSTSFTWTISTSGGGGGSQLLLNPGFESGAVNWTGTAGPITNNTGRPARTGSWKMWLGGNGTTATENEAQSVTIPASATSATLTFWIRIDTSETTTSTAYDTAKVQIVNGSTTSTLATYSNLNKNSTYVQKSFDVSAYKGKTISVKFLMNEDSSLQTSFVVDDTALNVS